LLRAYRRRVVDNVPFESDGFLAGTEILVNGILMGYRAAEYPTVLHSRAFGVSKAKIARTIRAHLGFQARVLLHRLGVRRLAGNGGETGKETR
jgi:dolichol-phosphate mannosyltransferase